MDESEEIKLLKKRIAELEAEKRLIETVHSDLRNFFELCIQNIPYPVFYKDRAGIYRYCNQAFLDFNCWTREACIGKTVHEAVEDQKLAEVYHQADLELMRTKGHQNYTSQVKDKKGVVHDVIFNKNVFLDHEGNVTGLIGFIVDITLQKETERELKMKNEEYESLNEEFKVQLQETSKAYDVLSNRENLFRELSENINDVFIMRDADQNLIYVSPKLTAMFGRPLEEIQPSSPKFIENIHPDDKKLIAEKMIQLRKEKQSSYEQEFRYIMPDKSIKWIWTRGYDIRNDNGVIYRSISLFTDITTLKQTNCLLYTSGDPRWFNGSGHGCECR